MLDEILQRAYSLDMASLDVESMLGSIPLYETIYILIKNVPNPDTIAIWISQKNFLHL